MYNSNMTKRNISTIMMWAIPIFLLISAITGLFIADSNQSITCSQRLTPTIRYSEGALELRITNLHPIEPTFDGWFNVFSTHPDDMYIQHITIT